MSKINSEWREQCSRQREGCEQNRAWLARAAERRPVFSSVEKKQIFRVLWDEDKEANLHPRGEGQPKQGSAERLRGEREGWEEQLCN